MADWDLFIRSVHRELQERMHELPELPDTLYIGGGTPSVIPPDKFASLIGGIEQVIGKERGWLEFTVEVNPDDVDEELCERWQDCGVNRVSMGVQSFVDSELCTIKRRHDSSRAFDAYDMLRRYFDNISIDLMFGLPGQTSVSWGESVDAALRLRPEHISAYSLMFEEGTPITVLREKGLLVTPSDEEGVLMWEILSDRLRMEGYVQYEISNYSLPGRESVHNRRYWKGNPYLGLGPSAHSYDGSRIRRANPGDLKGYLERFGKSACDKIFYKEEILTDEELMEELILTRMRTREGLDLSEVEHRFGSEILNRIIGNASKFVNEGMIRNEGGCLVLERRGIMMADEVIVGLSM